MALTRTENRGKRKLGLTDFLTSSSPRKVRWPSCGAPSVDGQKYACPTPEMKNELLFRSTRSSIASAPSAMDRTRCSLIALGFDSASRAIGSSLFSVIISGMGEPIEYASYL